jgi:hypothetical protein
MSTDVSEEHSKQAGSKQNNPPAGKPVFPKKGGDMFLQNIG